MMEEMLKKLLEMWNMRGPVGSSIRHMGKGHCREVSWHCGVLIWFVWAGTKCPRQREGTMCSLRYSNIGRRLQALSYMTLHVSFNRIVCPESQSFSKIHCLESTKCMQRDTRTVHRPASSVIICRCGRHSSSSTPVLQSAAILG